jgi:hypothetical protein
VLVDAGRLAAVQPATHERPELSVCLQAIHVDCARQVLLQVRLAQRLARAVRKSGDSVGGQAEQRCDLFGALLLDLGVPKNRLPPFGERLEGIGHKAVLKSLHGGLFGRSLVPERRLVRRHVVTRLGADPLVDEVHARAADDRKQVCAECEVGPIALLERAQHPRERLGNHIIDVGRGIGVLSGNLASGIGVTLVEHTKGRRIAGANASDQLGIAGHLSPERDHLVAHMPSSPPIHGHSSRQWSPFVGAFHKGARQWRMSHRPREGGKKSQFLVNLRHNPGAGASHVA